MWLYAYFFTASEGVNDYNCMKIVAQKTDSRQIMTVYPFRIFQIIFSASSCHLIVTVPECLIAFVVSHLPLTLAAIATL